MTIALTIVHRNRGRKGRETQRNTVIASRPVLRERIASEALRRGDRTYAQKVVDGLENSDHLEVAVGRNEVHEWSVRILEPLPDTWPTSLRKSSWS